jgi:hypothetical protein
MNILKEKPLSFLENRMKFYFLKKIDLFSEKNLTHFSFVVGLDKTMQVKNIQFEIGEYISTYIKNNIGYFCQEYFYFFQNIDMKKLEESMKQEFYNFDSEGGYTVSMNNEDNYKMDYIQVKLSFELSFDSIHNNVNNYIWFNEANNKLQLNYDLIALRMIDDFLEDDLIYLNRTKWLNKQVYNKSSFFMSINDVTNIDISLAGNKDITIFFNNELNSAIDNCYKCCLSGAVDIDYLNCIDVYEKEILLSLHKKVFDKKNKLKEPITFIENHNIK